MNSLAIKAATEDTLRDVAEDLIGSAVRDIVPVRGGGNNRVFRVEARDGRYALKFYPQQTEDPRDRQGAEIRALKFLEQYNVAAAPRAVAEDRVQGCALLDWIDGERIDWPDDDDIDRALKFLAELQVLVTADGAECLALASAATLSGLDVVRQIESRLSRIQQMSEDQPDLVSFLRNELEPAIERFEHRARESYAADGRRFDAQIAAHQRSLSPSDFGFHNALREGDGRIVFLDFEYFGWDDPTKLISDFLWHPGMHLSSPLKRRFLDRAGRVFGSRDDEFAHRLNALYPLFGICWCLIMLNEFLPERWLRRELASGEDQQHVAQARQLDRARLLLKTVMESNDSGPQFI